RPWRELTAARRNVETAQTGLVDAEKTLQVTQLRQRSGKGIQLEVLDALAVTANAREAVLRAQARFDIAAAALRRAAGDKL
ncbi:MAG: TolC family protein, partial [Vulcanimicrobiaceae bacterium]